MVESRVLIVDDEPSWRDIFRESIEDLNYAEVEGTQKEETYTVQVASSYEEADATLDRQHFHLALIDLRLQEGAEKLEGKKLVRKIAKLDEATSIIIVSGYADATIATELLKEYDVFYLIEKDNFDSKRLAEYVKAAISRAREQYRTKFESAMDFLSRDQYVESWAAEVLQAVLGPDLVTTTRDRTLLRNLLNKLLADLYPLLHHRVDKSPIIDSEAGVISARLWSKALGKPIFIILGRREVIDREVEDRNTRSGALVQRVFAQIERDQIEVDLMRMRGIVYVQSSPPFKDFERGL